MEYQTLTQALEAFDRYQKTLSAYRHAMGVLSLDAVTEAPEGSWEGRGQTMKVLSGVVYDLTVGKENGVLFDFLQSHLEELTDLQKRELEQARKEYDRMQRIPAQEFIRYNVLLNEADAV